MDCHVGRVVRDVLLIIRLAVHLMKRLRVLHEDVFNVFGVVLADPILNQNHLVEQLCLEADALLCLKLSMIELLRLRISFRFDPLM